MKKLPDQPSKLIRLALHDLQMAERARLNIDMGTWMFDARPDGGKCTVCFAGSVMRFSLKAKTKDDSFDGDRFVNPDEFDSDTAQKLYAINEFREGSIRNAFYRMGVEYQEVSFPEDGIVIDALKAVTIGPVIPDNVSVPNYSDDKRAFKRAMAKLADVLEEAGF